MTTAFIIVAMFALLLAVALYFQISATRKHSAESEKLLKDYQKRVDEQQRLLEDYRSLEKNFDSVGQGYEQALLAFDKMEEEKQKMLETKQLLEQNCNNLQQANGQAMELAHKKYGLFEQLAAKALAELQSADGIQRAAALVRKMSDLNEVASQSAIEKNDNVEAEKLVQQAVAQSGILDVSYFDFDVKLAPEASTAKLHTNAAKAVQALMALLDNAMKFTTDGKVVLAVDKQGDNISFAVEDTGMGIAPDDAEKAFGDFVQLNSYFDGMGIGLSAARSIARRLDGDIVLDTNYAGPGSRFVLTLPV